MVVTGEGEFKMSKEFGLSLRNEIEQILNSNNPLADLDSLMESGRMQEILPEIVLLGSESGEQDCCWHPEGSAWQHTKLVIEELRLQDADFILLFAGLLHDIGKPATQKRLAEGKITNDNHAKVGAEIAGRICQRFGFEKQETFQVTELVRLHMQLHFLAQERIGKLCEILERSDIDNLIKLQHADVMGTGRVNRSQSSHKQFLLAKLAELQDVISRPPLVSGDQLIEWGFETSKVRPIVIEALRAQREETFNNLAGARQWVIDVFGGWDGSFDNFPIKKRQVEGGNL